MPEQPIWSLTPGEKIVRKELHLAFGGRKQGGIGPSAQSPNIFLFSDPEVGKRHGYIDDWKSDGCYHYTGEGQKGDQRMRSGNLTILEHRKAGRHLRLFRGVGGLVTYVGEFEVSAELPFYMDDAPETGGGPIRAVIVFRLRPLDVKPPLGATSPALPKVNSVSEVDLEATNSEKFFVNPSREPYEAEKVEANLVKEFCNFLRHAEGLEARRLKITPAGEAKPLFCDIYVKSKKLLIEAKGTVERGSIRMAIGQLIDYSRFEDVEHKALLLPSIPRQDLLHLIRSANMGVYYKSEDGFSFIAP